MRTILRASCLVLLSGIACTATQTSPRAITAALPLVDEFPGLATLLTHAAIAPAWSDGERFRIAASGRQAITADLPASADGTFSIGVNGSATRIGVRRLERLYRSDGLESIRAERGRVAAGTVAWGDAAVMFARGPALEDIIVAPSSGADVGYELSLPKGWSLRALDVDRVAVVEVRDEQGHPWARMSADRAWDAGGHEHRVLARVDGSRIHLRVEGGAKGRVAIDPTWISAGYPIAIRVGGTSTPLANGTVLLAGGGTATAELYDPATGTFTAAGVAKVVRRDATASLLPSGKVALIAGRNATGFESSVEIYDPSARKFDAAGSLATPRAGHASTVLANGSVLVVGGTNGADLSTTEVYDPATGTSTSGPNMAEPRSRPIAVRLLSGKVLVVPEMGPTEIYDPSTKAFAAGPTLNTLPRSGQTATLLPSGKVLIAGGCTRRFSAFVCSSAGYLFDPASTAGEIPATGTLVEARAFHSSTLLADGKVLLAGGALSATTDGSPTSILSAEVYDPVAGTFSSAGTLSTSRIDANAAVLPSGDVLITGGETGSDVFALPATGTFATVSPLPATRVALVAAPLISGKLLLVGGGTTSALLVDPATKSVAATGSLAAARTKPTLTTLRNGDVLVAGDGAGAAPEIYDAKVGTFSTTGAMVTDRRGHTATLLPNGKVLVTGGKLAAGSVASTAELFDPATKTFTATGAMAHARVDHAATLLATGKVLVVGGSSTATGELFDPNTGTFTTVAAPLTARSRVATVAMASGKVLIAGGSTRATEIYDPVTGSVSFGASLAAPRPALSATLLPSGRVLLFGGNAGIGAPTAELFDPQSGRVFATATASTPRDDAAVALLSGAQVLVAGGVNRVTYPVSAEFPLSTAEVWDDGLPSGRPRLDTVPALVRAGDAVTVKGSGIAPAWSAGSGTVRASTAIAPTAIWIPLSGSGAAVGTLSALSDTQATWTVPPTSLWGLGRLFVSVGGAVSNGVIVEIQPASQGARCSVGAECSSGFCADGVCCDSACDGRCRACTAAKKGTGADGVCGDVPPELDPASCALFRGSPCKNDAQCGTGHCVDGVCCDTACTGQCEACDVDGSFGLCVPVSGPPHGARTACEPGGADPCTAKVCDGTARTSCAGYVGAKVSCRAPSCTSGVATLAAACDGSGACPAAVTKRCDPYVCAGDDCGKAPCTTDAECASEFRCAIAQGATRGECVVRTDNVCDGEHTVTARDGRTTDCAPYRCDVSGCKTSCATSEDCVGGSLCDTSAGAGKCVPAAVTSEPESSGCMAGRRGGSSALAAIVALLATCAFRARRRRR